MTLEELLELKKMIDESNLCYAALKDSKEEIEEKLYANNQMNEEELENNGDIIPENKYLTKKTIEFWIRMFILAVGDVVFDFSSFLYVFLYIINAIIFSLEYFFGYSNYVKRNSKKKPVEPIDIDALNDELDSIEEKLKYFKEKSYELSCKLDKEISNLDKEAYQEYLDYVSDYMISILEDNEQLLKDTKECIESNLSDVENKKVLR